MGLIGLQVGIEGSYLARVAFDVDVCSFAEEEVDDCVAFGVS